MEKLTRKQLKGLGENLVGYYCGGNVYNHENIIQYINSKRYEELSKYSNKNNQIDKLKEHLQAITNTLDKYIITCNQIAYSCGTYGNTGQLVRYEIFDTTDNNDWILKDVFFTYYC